MKDLINNQTCLVLGNVWDPLSAIIHEQSGFKAIGTTSWGIGNSLGFNDGEKISLPQLKSVVENILKVISIPLSVDIESGYGQTNEEVVENVLYFAGIGCSGINIEDSTPSGDLKDKNEFSSLVKMIKSELLEKKYNDFCLNVRTDTYIKLDNPLEETIERGLLYQESGADGLFVPCISEDDDIKAVIDKIDIPLNVMSLPNLCDINHLSDLGVKRFSYGNAMSDAIVSKIESLVESVYQQNNTSALYEHESIKTNFK